MRRKKQKPAFELLSLDEHIVSVTKASGCDAETLKKLLWEEYGPVFTTHRVDADASGAAVFARTKQAQVRIAAQFASGKASLVYEAIVPGKFGGEALVMDFPLVPDADSLHRTVVDKRRGKKAETKAHLLDQFGPYAHIRVTPVTVSFRERAHQVRVHLKAAGFPVLCDLLYGNGGALLLSAIKRSYRGDAENEKPLIARTALHVSGLSFLHPTTGEPKEIKAEYARDFAAALNQLKKIFR